MLTELTVNELLRAIDVAVDPIDRDHVKVRLIVHGTEDSRSATARAAYVNAGTGHPFVNIVGIVGGQNG